jgi:hypothetical protein
MDTVYLNPTTWDFDLDANGNIALATGPYALAQDAASAIKTFAGEVWYDTTLGVPYLTLVLGKYPSIVLLKTLFEAAAMTVPGVTAAEVVITSIAGGVVTGQVLVTDSSGGSAIAGF